MKRLAFAFVLLSSPALAQQPDYAPPSKDLWVQMVQAIQNVPMSASAHAQVSQILTTVQQQAQAAAAPKPEPKKPEAKQ